jgi:hypothetical protein
MFNSPFDYVVVVAAFPFITYFLLLTITRRWWRRLAGWSAWLLGLVLTILLASSVWRQLVEVAPPDWFRWVSGVLFTAVGWFQLVAFLIVVARGDRRPAATVPERGTPVPDSGRRRVDLGPPRATGERRHNRRN